MQLDLPQYSSYEVLRAKLLYAIAHGQAIDTDHGNIRVWDDTRGDDDDDDALNETLTRAANEVR